MRFSTWFDLNQILVSEPENEFLTRDKGGTGTLVLKS